MKHVTLITCLYLVIISVLSAFLQSPLLFVCAMIIMPMFIQSLPWGLAADEYDGCDDEHGPNDPQDDYQGTKSGFMSTEVQSRKKRL